MSEGSCAEDEWLSEPAALRAGRADLLDEPALMGKDSVHVIELAVSTIAAWAMRNDVHHEAMRLAQCDLPRGHAWLLGRLNTCGPIRLGELACALGIDSSTLTPQAQRLEREGLVIREPDPRDRRAALLRVTYAGQSLLSRLHASRRTLLAARLHAWSDAERAGAAAILSRLAAAL